MVKRKGRFNPIRWGKVARRAVFRMNRRNDKPSTLVNGTEVKEILNMTESGGIELQSAAVATQNDLSEEGENEVSFSAVDSRFVA